MITAIAVCGAGPARGDLIASWQMPVAIPTGVTGSSYTPPNVNGASQWPASGTPYAAGTPTTGLLAGNAAALLSARHASSSATYTSPSGNGSSYAFSSTHWAIGDYYQVVLPTTGWTGLSLTWDQARSASGPSSFDLTWSTDGTNFSTAKSYTVSVPSPAWNTTTANSSSTFSSPLAPAAGNVGILYLRFTATSTASGTAGTNRIDNISISASTPVPEIDPAGMGSVGAFVSGALALLGRHRRRSA